jgi:hypothetical protein
LYKKWFQCADRGNPWSPLFSRFHCPYCMERLMFEGLSWLSLPLGGLVGWRTEFLVLIQQNDPFSVHMHVCVTVCNYMSACV